MKRERGSLSRGRIKQRKDRVVEKQNGAYYKKLANLSDGKTFKKGFPCSIKKGESCGNTDLLNRKPILEGVFFKEGRIEVRRGEITGAEKGALLKKAVERQP